MANNTFNPVQEMQYSYNPSKLSDRDKFLIEALLADSGVIGAVAAPQTPGPLPAPTPAPAPTPTPAPPSAPAAQAPVQGSYFTANVILQLALTKVKPGDLITPDFANNLIDAYLALEARVQKLEGIGRATPSASTPTPTAPAPAPTPTPPPASEAALTGFAKGESGARPAPTIESVTATTVRGKGVTIAVIGDNMGEGAIERVSLGATAIAPASIKFSRTGFSFLTTTAIVSRAKNRLTVVTANGEDSAPITAVQPQ